MIDFQPYASSSSGNLYTVSDGKTMIMLDCGLPWKKARELLQFKTSHIAGILLTHRHMDHCKGAKDAARAGIDIYASHPTFNSLQVPDHRANVIEHDQQFQIGTWTILPFETIHDTEGALGFYMVNNECEAFLYLTDTAYSPVRFARLHVVAIECNNIEEILSGNIVSGHMPTSLGHRVRRSHMSLERVISMIKANDLSTCRQIWLLHLSDANSNEELMRRKVQETVGVPVYVAQS